MTVKAIFVGVNRYLGPAIAELSGARRDAMALWASFTDTIEGLAARRLVDQEATHSDVSDAILGTLEGAHEDDVIVITFAGHGSGATRGASRVRSTVCRRVTVSRAGL